MEVQCKKGKFQEGTATYEVPCFTHAVAFANFSEGQDKCFVSPNYELVTDFYGHTFTGKFEIAVGPGCPDVDFVYRQDCKKDANYDLYPAKISFQLVVIAAVGDEVYLNETKTNGTVKDFWTKQWNVSLNQFKSALFDSPLRVTMRLTCFCTEDDAVTDLRGSGSAIPYAKYLADRQHTDLKIICDGEEFPVHSLILKCVSPVITKMLESNMLEASTHRIFIDDVGPEPLKAFLDFIYTGSFGSPSDPMILEILYCAEKYDVKELIHAAMVYMLEHVSPENAVRFTAAALRDHTDEQVKQQFVERFKRMYESVPKDGEFKEFMRTYVDILY
jgi:hypothetical protein